jgi:hypothetical protein
MQGPIRDRVRHIARLCPGNGATQEQRDTGTGFRAFNQEDCHVEGSKKQ